MVTMDRRHFKFLWKTHSKENQISTNFDRKFYIFDRLAEKQFPYQKTNNVYADRRLKIESPPLPASKKQSKEIHRNLLVDQSTTRLLLCYNSFTTVSFIHNIHSFIHSFV